MNRFRTLLALLLALTLVAAACNGDDNGTEAQNGNGEDQAQDGEDQEPSGEPIVIGAVYSQSGPLGSLGQAELDGAELAVEHFNDRGGADGRPLELVSRDPESEAEQAVTATRELVTDEGVFAVIGPESTTIGNSMIEILTEAEIPSISQQGGVNLDEEAGTVFGNGWTGTHVVEASIRYLEDAGVENLGYISTADALGEAGDRFGLPLFEDAGFEVSTQTVQPDDQDFTAAMTALERDGVESVFMWATGAPAVIAAENFGELDMPGNLLLLNVTPALAEQFGAAAESVLVAQTKLAVFEELPEDDPHLPVMEEFAEIAEAAGLNGNDPFLANGWGAVRTFVESIEEVGADQQAILDLWRGGFDLDWNPAGRVHWEDENHQGFNSQDLVMTQIDPDTGEFSLFTG